MNSKSMVSEEDYLRIIQKLNEKMVMQEMLM